MQNFHLIIPAAFRPCIFMRIRHSGRISCDIILRDVLGLQCIQCFIVSALSRFLRRTRITETHSMPVNLHVKAEREICFSDIILFSRVTFICVPGFADCEEANNRHLHFKLLYARFFCYRKPQLEFDMRLFAPRQENMYITNN